MLVHRLNCADHCRFIFNMTNNIHIREIHDSKVAGRIFYFGERRAGYFFNGHFRGFIKQLDVFTCRDDDSFFIRQQITFLAVEKKLT